MESKYGIKKKHQKTNTMNSYQKMKARLKELESKLSIVCNEPDSRDAVLIRAEEKLKFRIEKAIWAGSAVTMWSCGEMINK